MNCNSSIYRGKQIKAWIKTKEMWADTSGEIIGKESHGFFD